MVAEVSRAGRCSGESPSPFSVDPRRQRLSNHVGGHMSQDRESGARANAWGRSKSKEIALALNATQLSSNSNECTLGEERVVIKCARRGNNKIGVPYKMLPRIARVIA